MKIDKKKIISLTISVILSIVILKAISKHVGIPLYYSFFTVAISSLLLDKIVTKFIN